MVGTVGRRGALVLAAVLLLQILASAGTALHDTPKEELDEVTFEREPGYVAWRINVTPAEDDDRARVYVDLGNETTAPRFEDADYGHLGFWMINLDHGYVWLKAGGTIPVNDGQATVHADDPPADQDLSIASEGDADGHAYLSTPGGEWLVLVVWATDGEFHGETRLSGGIHEGETRVSLVNRSTGADTFSLVNADFDGGTQANVATPTTDLPDFPPWSGLPESGQARSTEGAASADVGSRFFGLFSAWGNLEGEGSWEGPAGHEDGGSVHWFSGAEPGRYTFHVQSKNAGERAPVAAFGAGVDIPEAN